MTSDEIQYYLQLLGEELQKRQVTGEIVLAGGTMMLLVIRNRETTKDVDAYFATNPQLIREAARVIALRENLPDDWINDGLKGFFYTSPPTTLWLDYPGLRVYHANADYVLAMKAAAGRPEDIPDIQALAAYLHLSHWQEIIPIVIQYIPPQYLTPRTEYLIQSLFP
jgi:predicted nucleotidyltransferase